MTPATTPADGLVRTPVPAVDAERKALGSQYRDAVDHAQAAMQASDFELASTRLQPVIAYCDRLLADGRALVSVTNASEYQSYMASRRDAAPVDWVDMACPEAYKMRGYIEVEAQHLEQALAFLDKATTLAPLWSDPRTERGFVLNQLHRSNEALADYRLALELIAHYPSNAGMKAIALRGLGFTLVELGDLQAAEKAYRDSLVVEPGNALAKRELEYIRRQREMAVQ